MSSMLLLIGCAIAGFITGSVFFDSSDSIDIHHQFVAGGGVFDSEDYGDEEDPPTSVQDTTVVVSTTPTTTTTAATTSTTTTTTTTTAATTTTTAEEPMKYYVPVRTDRAGSAICGYLLAHSFAHANNATYVGACWDSVDWPAAIAKHGEKFVKKVAKRQDEQKELIQFLGLTDELPYACPSDADLKAGRSVILRKRHDYKLPGYTVEWLNSITSKSHFPYKKKDPNAPLDVAVHVRRGDFTPCHVSDRYLPNVYYERAMDKYLPEVCDKHPAGCKITLYSERDAYEPFDDFLKRPNLQIDFDSSSDQIWTDFINADVLIMSMSSFSFVPALLNNNGHVISPYRYGEFGYEEDIPSWNMVDDDILQEALEVREEQYKDCPKK